MSRPSETAYAKLNLALHVRSKRSNGYHEIETVFVFCEDGDGLTIERADHSLSEVAMRGPFGADIGQGNLVTAAYWAMREATGIEGGARFTLDKVLPVAGGIGGGSADAAAALRLITREWALEPQIAEQVAPQLGTDVPACLLSQSCRGSGAGDELEPIDLGISGTPVLLINPGAPLSTRDVFQRWDGVDRGPLGDWRDGRNDLEAPAIALVPEIAEMIDWLRKQPGAEFVRMSGSGATCFALFAGETERDQAAAAVPERWWRLATRLR